ncbi:MAG TPA: methyltransferase domain-containing protein [Candidatus Berkiella sp.]|nr:methyltransferase domain-containing protein [Candidatus Berkiella sp.]
MVAENEYTQRWYTESVASWIIDAEKDELEIILAKLYGYHLVYIGDSSLTPLVETSLISHRVLINPQVTTNGALSGLPGELEALPLRTDSVDVVVLAHTLEHAVNPHEILREAHRILIPEGHIVITGFNPMSLWGLWHGWKQMTGKIPRQGKMLTSTRLKDWLKLLNFQIVDGKAFYFRPPLSSLTWQRRLNFLEGWGENCWPFFGGAYTLVAVKRVVPLLPMRARFKPEKSIWQPAEGLPKPTTTVR